VSQAPPTGWETLVIVLPSVLAFLTAALGTVLTFLTHAQGGRNAISLSDIHDSVNGGMKTAKAEIIALKLTVARLESIITAHRTTEAERTAAVPPVPAEAATDVAAENPYPYPQG